MNTKPEALRLAKELVLVHQGHADEGPSTFSEAAAELRRLHNEVTDLKQALEIADAVFKERDKLDSVNADLLQALKDTLDNMIEWGAMASLYEQEKYGLVADINMAKAAIAKAKGETK
jgi:hypothetical protein